MEQPSGNKDLSCAPGLQEQVWILPWGVWRVQMSPGERGFIKAGKGKDKLGALQMFTGRHLHELYYSSLPRMSHPML